MYPNRAKLGWVAQKPPLQWSKTNVAVSYWDFFITIKANYIYELATIVYHQIFYDHPYIWIIKSDNRVINYYCYNYLENEPWTMIVYHNSLKRSRKSYNKNMHKNLILWPSCEICTLVLFWLHCNWSQVSMKVIMWTVKMFLLFWFNNTIFWKYVFSENFY